MPAASAPPGMVTRSGSHDGLETHTVVILGLDPRIALIPYRLNSSHFSVVRAATDARVRPEHDGRRPHVHHNENCCVLHRPRAQTNPPAYGGLNAEWGRRGEE